MVRKAFLASVFVVFFPTIALGQAAITGQITGVVTDPSGAAVPNASITVAGSALMGPRTTTTHTDGTYLIAELPPGTYDLTVAVSGFKTYAQKGVVITVGFTATVNVALQVGEALQTVEVTGKAPVVDVKTVSNNTTFDYSLLQNIPSGRDPLVDGRRNAWVYRRPL